MIIVSRSKGKCHHAKSLITLEREVSSCSKGKCHHTQSDAVSLLERLDGNDRGSDGVPATGGVRALRLSRGRVRTVWTLLQYERGGRARGSRDGANRASRGAALAARRLGRVLRRRARRLTPKTARRRDTMYR